MNPTINYKALVNKWQINQLISNPKFIEISYIIIIFRV